MARLYILIFIIGLVGSVGYGAYSYVVSMQNQIMILKENNVKLEQAVETSQATIKNMQADAARNAELQAELSQNLAAARGRLDSLRGRLAEIDISREALADPNNMEGRINRGVERLIERIYEETGGVKDEPIEEPTATDGATGN